MSEEMEMNLEQPSETSAETVSDEILSDAEAVTEEAEAAETAESEGSENTEETAEDAEEEKAKWYVVHTYSGYENKVKVNLEKTIENRHLQDQILEVLVPLQDVV